MVFGGITQDSSINQWLTQGACGGILAEMLEVGR